MVSNRKGNADPHGAGVMSHLSGAQGELNRLRSGTLDRVVAGLDRSRRAGILRRLASGGAVRTWTDETHSGFSRTVFDDISWLYERELVAVEPIVGEHTAEDTIRATISPKGMLVAAAGSLCGEGDDE